MEVILQALAPNPETGFLEADSPANVSFSSDKKLLALQLANQYIQQKTYPVLREIAAAVGISLDLFYKHLRADAKFHEAWNDIKLKINDVFTEHLVLKSKSKTGVIANLAILKYNESGTWLDQTKLNLSTNVIINKNEIIDAKSALDAEGVSVSLTKGSILNQPASNNVLIESPKHEI